MNENARWVKHTESQSVTFYMSYGNGGVVAFNKTNLQDFMYNPVHLWYISAIMRKIKPHFINELQIHCKL